MTQPLTVQQLERLHADLHPLRVAKREGGGGRQLSYLEAYDVRATLTRIFGYGNWSGETVETRVVHESQYKGPNDRELWRIAVVCTFRLTIHQTGAVYTESAAASQSGPDFGEVLDFAVKTAESDALKRAATNLGTTFGLSLYDNGKTGDVVRTVYAPDQWEIIEDLKAARGEGEQAGAARERMQARLKTQPAAAVVVEAQPEQAIDAPVTVTEQIVEEPVSPANEEPTEPVVDPVAKAAEDLERVTATRKPRAARTTTLAAVS